MNNFLSKKQKRKRSAIGLVAFGALCALLLSVPFVAFGQINVNTVPGSTFGLGTADLLSTVIKIVQWALGLLGLVAVIIIIYGGYLWLTAAGREEQVRKAKRVLTQAVIGLVIILLAWAIVAFIVNTISNSTGASGGSCTDGTRIGYPSCQICASGSFGPDPSPTDPLCYGAGGPLYTVQWEIPQNAQTNVSLCSVVSAGLNGVTPPWIDPATVNDTNILITDSGGNAVGGTFWPLATPPDVNFFEFKSSSELLANETYDVQVTSGVRSQSGVSASTYTWSFTTGVTSDANPPIVSNWAPQGSAVCLAPVIQVIFNEPMAPSSFVPSNIVLTPPDAAVVSVLMTGSNSFTANLSNPLQGNTAYTVTLNADVTTGIRDACYNSLDCGNTPNVCTSNGTEEGTPADDFVWTFTTDDTSEIDCDPEITGVDPAGPYSSDGGDSITLQGKNLGIIADTIFFKNKFWNNLVDATSTIGVASKCFNTSAKPNSTGPDSIACVQTWTDDHVDVVVPSGQLGQVGSGATAGDIMARVGGITMSDPSAGFSSLSSPHIRAISPSFGGEGQFITIAGENFTSTPGDVWLRRDDGYEVQAQTCNASAWGDTQIVAIIPTGTNFVVGDQIRVQVDSGEGNPNSNDRSNLYTFTLTNDPPTPGICSIVPTCHENAPNTVTIDGEFFGTAAGQGYYGATGSHAPNIYIGTPGAWSETQVQLTSPSTLPNDIFNVYIEDSSGRVSNPIGYQVPCTPGASLIYQNQCNLSAIPPVTPSPNPFPESQDVCVNLNRITFRFSESIIPGGMANFELRRCTNGKSDCETNFTPVGIGAVIGNPAGTDYVQLGNFLPSTFDADAWYRVTVRGNIRNILGVEIGDDEVWYFKTRADATPCVADSLGLAVTNVFGPAIYSEPYTGHPNELEYTATTYTNSCQVIVPSGSYAWSSSDPSIAQCQGGTCVTIGQQNIETQLKDGTTQIGASIGGLSAEKPLTVQLNYCQTNSDCNCNGVQSQCNLAAMRCEPFVESVMQPSGPADTLVTITGCFFGNTAGNVQFIDQANPSDERNGVNLCTFPQWNNTTITIGTPNFSLGTVTDVNVQSVYSGGLLLDSFQRGLFSYADTCGGLIPPFLCSLYPLQTGEGTSIAIDGLNMPNGAGVDDDVLFEPSLSSPAITWTSTTETHAEVPVGAITVANNVEVQKDYGAGTCLSNPLSLTVSCTEHSQCGTGCCQANACVDHVYCETVSAGTQCRVPSNPSTSCQIGYETDPLGNLTCISNTGFTESKNPPPPPQGSACQFCCDPDPNNDGNYADADTNGLGLSCTAIPASVTADPTCRSANDNANEQRGLFCGCTSDLQCGSGTGCAKANDPYRCCRAMPTFSASTPSNAAPLACLNSVFTFTYNTGGPTVVMDSNSINASTISAVDGGGNPIPGTIRALPNGFTFSPSEPYLAQGSTITITDSTAVQNMYGIAIPAPTSRTWTISPTGTLCEVSSVRLEWYDTILGDFRTTPLFARCALNGCISDAYPIVQPGAQNFWMATALDSAGNTIAGPVYNWEESGNNGIFSINLEGAPPYASACPNGMLGFGCLGTVNPQNGRGTFTVTADGGASLGSATATGTEINYLCENPWPDPVTAPAPYDEFPFQDDDYNFSMNYCRDSGLPELRLGSVLSPATTSPLVKNGTIFTPNFDDTLREYIFVVTDESGNRIGRDSVGVAVMENELHLPPDLWYKRRFPQESQSGSLISVNGYPAWQIGRTVYVAGTNIDTSAPGPNNCQGPGSKCSNGVMYSNIYLFSYSDGAGGSTVEAYNQLLNNLVINTNISSDTERQQIRNDVKRIQDFRRMAILFSDYKKQTGFYPGLSAGSYIEDITTSVWPSWAETLSTLLNTTLPVDPINKMGTCSAGHDPDTCWDETAKTYDVGTGSYVYQYNNFRSMFDAWLMTRLEYMGAGSWRTVASPTGVHYPLCSTTVNPQWASAQCDTNFNYAFSSTTFEPVVTLYQTTGALDTDPPENLGMSGFNPPIDGDRAISATATDARPTDSGMDRVEFYYKASSASLWALDHTDSDESDGWTWALDPSSLLAGNYDFMLRAFDQAGNMAEFSTLSVALALAQGDLVAPTIAGFTIGPVVTTITNPASIAASGITSLDGGSIFYVSYWDNPATVSRCNDQLTGCSVVQTAPSNPLPPANDSPQHDYSWIGEDRARPSDVLVTYTPLDVPNATYPPRKVFRFSKQMAINEAPKAEYTIFNVTHVVGNSNGDLVVVTSGNTLRTFDPATAEYNPVAGIDTRTHGPVSPGGIQGLEVDDLGNIYVSQVSGTIRKYDSSLNLVASYSGLNNPYGLHVSGSRLYVAEYGTGNIVVLNTALTAVLETYPGFSGATDVFEKGGDIYVGGANTVRKFTPVREVVGVVTFSTSASDNIAINHVDYYIKSATTPAAFIASVTIGSPYVYSWDSAGMSDGDYEIFAVAFDAAGNTSISKQAITTKNGNDSIAPSVFISSPSNGATISGIVNVIATATDNQGVQDVRFQVDGVDWNPTACNSTLYENPDTASPYSWPWDSSRNGDCSAALPLTGSAQLRVIATDINGNTNQDTIVVNLNNTTGGFPSAWFVDPEDGDVFAPGNFEVYATDPDGTVDHVELFNAAGDVLLDNENVAFNTLYDLNWDYSLPDGDYQFYTIAEDNVGNRSSATGSGATVNVRIDTVNPVITAFSPADNVTLAGTESFSATATDLNGVDKIELYLVAWPPNGNHWLIGACDAPGTVSPYSCTITYDTTQIDDGDYIGVAIATDRAGLTGSVARLNWQIDNIIGGSGPSPMPACSTWPNENVAPKMLGKWIGPVRVGQPVSYQIWATNSPTSYTASSLPSWLTLNAATGILSGTPTAASGRTIVTVGATNAYGSSTQNIVFQALACDFPVLDDDVFHATVGTPFSQVLTATPALTAADLPGVSTLPPGLSWNASTRTISGTPTTSGVYSAYVRLTSGSCTVDNLSAITIVVDPLEATESVGNTFSHHVNDSYQNEQAVCMTGLPAGVTYDRFSESGLFDLMTISGTPTAEGVFPISFTLYNSDVASSVSGVLTLTVTGVAPDSTPPSDPAISLSPEYLSPTLQHFSTTNINDFNTSGQVRIISISPDQGAPPSGLAYIDVYIDGALLDPNSDGYSCVGGEIVSDACNIQWPSPTAGAHTISSVSQDNDGNMSNSVSVSANIDNTNPVGQIISPRSGYYYSGIVDIVANLSDGTGSGIQKFEAYADSPSLGTDTAPAWSIPWDTTIGGIDGNFNVTITVYDNVGNSAGGITDPVQVVVNNGSIPGTNCGPNVCGVGMNCCNVTCYNPVTHKCCSGGVVPIAQTCVDISPK